MRKILLFCALGLILSACTHRGPVRTDMFSVSSFTEMEGAVESLGREEIAHTLIVMDDDDTLTMMTCPDQANTRQPCQYLGGPAWYSWQSDLIRNDVISEYRVAETSGDLLEISALLLAANKMPYTDGSIPEVLKRLTDQGARLLVLTARGEANISATEAQFSALKPVKSGKKSTFLDFIRSNALNGRKGQIPSIAGPITPSQCTATRAIAYQQGIMYVAGQNKGDMLHCILGKTDSGNIRNIAFIDDTLVNVQNVYDAFPAESDYSVLAMHYTRLSKHKKALTKAPEPNELQKTAHRRWQAIQKSLRENLEKPAIP